MKPQRSLLKFLKHIIYGKCSGLDIVIETCHVSNDTETIYYEALGRFYTVPQKCLQSKVTEIYSLPQVDRIVLYNIIYTAQ